MSICKDALRRISPLHLGSAVLLGYLLRTRFECQ